MKSRQGTTLQRLLHALVVGAASTACGGILGVDFDDARPRSDGKASFPGADGGGGENEPVPPSEDGTCATGRKLCDGFCVSKTDPAYGCGETCGPACESGLLCSNGTCASSCSGSEIACGQACFDLSSSAEHCGSCDRRCVAPANGTVACVDSKCVATCASGLVDDGAGKCVVEGDGGEVERIAAGTYSTCGVRANGELACWGNNDNFRSTPPAGTFKQVSMGLEHVCAVRSDGTVACWGSNNNNRATPPVADTFIQVGVNRHSCGVKTDGTVVCWGANDYGKSTPPAGTFREVAAAFNFSCGIRTDRTIVCWGREEDAKTPPTGAFKQISVSTFLSCALAMDGTIKCWGANSGGAQTPPAGTFRSVRVAEFGACGVQTDDTVRCWGNLDGTVLTTKFRSVSLGFNHACGIHLDGTAECWGNNDEGQRTPPAGAIW